MVRKSLLLVLLASLSLPVVVAGCAAPDDVTEAEGESNSAITGSVAVGTRLKTTSRLNFREGPSTSDAIVRTLAVGTVVTVVDGSPQNGFYNVSAGGDEGWVHGSYIKSSTAVSSDDEDAKGEGTTSTKGTTTGAVETCKASFYDDPQETANGETFNPNALTAAHKTLKFNTRVRVTNTANGKSVDVRINDRGPFVAGRCIDLSRAAFAAIASTSAGVASVKLETLQ